MEEQSAAAKSAPKTLAGDQDVALARDSWGNFILAAIRKAYGGIKNETALISKGVREGPYRGIGGAITVAAIANYWPAIAQFIAERAEALKTFARLVYNNPSVSQMIDAIAKHLLPWPSGFAPRLPPPQPSPASREREQTRRFIEISRGNIGRFRPLSREAGEGRGGGADASQASDVTKRARKMRREMTNAERKLWAALRGHRLENLQFRRQAPCGPYIADFLCHAARLVVEVDGATHSSDVELARDARRDAWFAERGFAVLRVTNAEVYDSFDAVVDTIWIRATERLAPTPTLPRFAGEGADSAG